MCCRSMVLCASPSACVYSKPPRRVEWVPDVGGRGDSSSSSSSCSSSGDGGSGRSSSSTHRRITTKPSCY